MYGMNMRDAGILLAGYQEKKDVLIFQNVIQKGEKMGILDVIDPTNAPSHEIDGSWDTVDLLRGVMRIRKMQGKKLYRSWIE